MTNTPTPDEWMECSGRDCPHETVDTHYIVDMEWIIADRLRTAKEIKQAMQDNNDPWRNHIGVVDDYIAELEA